ncbi:IS200/IS605 family transposase [Enterococcus faecalis]|uniref:IS200/IS605 family transposase n=1 Tax=Enterococcus faecalis TaxID=1351 RepID=UPI00039BF811|nr:IS200/IS605 family transposase [Enterococcus faecalis]
MSEIHYGRGYVYSIQYHLVWCVKYRHDILYGHVDIDLKKLLKQIADDNDVKIVEMESDKDHIHLLIECTPGKFFVSILCEEEMIEYPKCNSAIGIDLGITDFAILSDGQKIDNNKFTSKMEKKLKREQRKLSRRALLAKEKGINLFEAKNYQKQKRKVARFHEKVMNQRTDFLNKLSTEMIKNHDIICIENLNTKGLLRNHKLAKNISDVSWSSFVTKLQYKADWYGREIIKIDKWFPSSQICSECGHKDGKKPLDIREWTCPICHTHHDQDTNASINILTEGLRIQSLV